MVHKSLGSPWSPPVLAKLFGRSPFFHAISDSRSGLSVNFSKSLGSSPRPSQGLSFGVLLVESYRPSNPPVVLNTPPRREPANHLRANLQQTTPCLPLTAPLHLFFLFTKFFHTPHVISRAPSTLLSPSAGAETCLYIPSIVLPQSFCGLLVPHRNPNPPRLP